MVRGKAVAPDATSIKQGRLFRKRSEKDRLASFLIHNERWNPPLSLKNSTKQGKANVNVHRREMTRHLSEGRIRYNSLEKMGTAYHSTQGEAPESMNPRTTLSLTLATPIDRPSKVNSRSTRRPSTLL